MNRRELLKNAGKFLGLATIAPLPSWQKDNKVEFRTEPPSTSDEKWVTSRRILHKSEVDWLDPENAIQKNHWNCKCEISWDISEPIKDKCEWIYFNGDRFFTRDTSFVDIISK